jgi:hypothetical protein
VVRILATANIHGVLGACEWLEHKRPARHSRGVVPFEVLAI